MAKKTVELKDITSTIKMLMSGKRMCGQQTRNIRIRYIYAHKRVTDGTIVVIYCPTKEMVSDYLSKLLQGSLFWVHCNTVIGITPAIDIQYKLLYAKNKVLMAKKAKDYLSV